MSVALSIVPPFSPSIWIRCGTLSLLLHVGLLTGLGLIPKSEPLKVRVPWATVTLIPPQAPTETEAPAKPPVPAEPTDPALPSMQNIPRIPVTVPQSPPLTPITLNLQAIEPIATLAIPEASPTVHRPNPSPKQRILKDTRASDALFAQSAAKMVNRSISSKAHSSSVAHSPLPNMNLTKLPTGHSLSVPKPSPSTIRDISLPSRTRRLMARPPEQVGSGITNIGIRHSVPPVYPRVAKEEGWEGVVLLRVLVHTNGMPGEITIRKSSGHKTLDEAAIEAIQQWRFIPAKDGGFAVRKHVYIPFKFGLHR